MNESNLHNIPPLWKRWIICTFLKREQARVARAYNAVCVDLFNQGRHTTFQYLRVLGDKKWEKLFGLPISSDQPKQLDNFERENERLETEVSWMRGRIEQLTRENELIKATAKKIAASSKPRAIKLP